MKALAVLLCLICSLAQAQPVLHVLSRHDFLPERTIARFVQHCQCLVEQDFYHDSEELVSRLSAGDADTDVVFPSSFSVPALLRLKLLQPLDKSRLPNVADLNPVLSNPSFDPGSQFTLPASMSLAAVGYNIDKLRELNIDPYSWSVIFDPRVLARLKGHVSVVDNPRSVFAAALLYLGLDPNSTRDEDYARAREVIAAARPYWSGFGGNYYWKDLVSGDAWVQLGFSAEFFQAREEARSQHKPYTIGYVLQKEGNQLAMDNMAIPAAAPHPALAARFINFLLAGRNAADLSNLNGATTAVLSAAPYFRDDIKYHPVINPDPSAFRKWVVLREMPAKRMRQLRHWWSELRTDRNVSSTPKTAHRRE
ncbi:MULTISPECIES: PotD/PotF family extracellular solute-binding protein [unclassified Paludibacterium]|uniref:ABC transporter substrate-binding protein n=1 Tax=unclassified Paludibacterium TaxID=2618429 RepID=UPI001C044CC9|nr:spermidine/putrescine ABC transporter substrate-binding protein [Paludibacterium sp. B53371]BEV72184.1 spermidine/putrescine ABC transporter substrate-binding protein [Paludibacterium sp. THUN1379]